MKEERKAELLALAEKLDALGAVRVPKRTNIVGVHPRTFQKFLESISARSREKVESDKAWCDYEKLHRFGIGLSDREAPQIFRDLSDDQLKEAIAHCEGILSK